MYQQFSSGNRCVPMEYQKAIPEAKDVYWNDDFFDEEEGVIAVFDFDYDLMEDFKFKVGAFSKFLQAGLLMFYIVAIAGQYEQVYVILLAASSVFLLVSLCLLRYQIQWQVRANHLAITRDGIRSVQDKQKSCLGWSMCDKGKHSKTVPFEKITDCDITEPAGNALCIVPYVLYTVRVDTASSGGEKSELQIAGLKDPHKFKSLVWAMKRQRDSSLGGGATGNSSKAGYQAPPTQLEMAERNPKDLETAAGDSSVTGLLKDIRDELRENNQLLRKIHESPAKLSGPSQV